MAHPPRLPSIQYTEPGTYFLTMCTDRRQPRFISPAVVDLTLDHFLQSATRHGVAISAYCFMPDHLHLLATIPTVGGSIPTFVHLGKQLSGYSYRQATATSLWQPGYYDRVLRADEDLLRVTAYIVANPMRAGLVCAAGDYPFWGSAEYTRDEVIEAIAAAVGAWWQP